MANLHQPTLRVAKSPFAKVVKGRGTLASVFGHFNMRKPGRRWHDIRLRQAINYAINREDLIRYATKGNGEVIPALTPPNGFGYNPHLAPYPFDPDKAQRLLREAGYTDGLTIEMIAPNTLEVQATVVSKMLERVGINVKLQVLSKKAYRQKTRLNYQEQSAEKQSWDIALNRFWDQVNFPSLRLYQRAVIDGATDWVIEQPILRQLYDQILSIVDLERQRALIQQMERHTHEQAYLLFLYNPIGLYAVNKAVELVPYANGLVHLAELTVTDQHWSVRQAAQSSVVKRPLPLRTETDNGEQISVGRALYAKHCASCHGHNLEGQTNWRRRLPSGNFPAPPHDATGHTWHHPDSYLFKTVKYGWQVFAPKGYTSAMIGFKDILTDTEIWAVLAFIKSHWPPSIRAQQEQLNRQKK